MLFMHLKAQVDDDGEWGGAVLEERHAEVLPHREDDFVAAPERGPRVLQHLSDSTHTHMLGKLARD